MKFIKSLEIKDEALKYIPNATQTAGKCFNQWALGTAPIFAKSGDGCELTCVDGNKYIDMLSSFGPTILGYNDVDVNDAITSQLQNGIIFSLSHEIECELAKLIVDTIPSIEWVKFAKSGTDVCNAAVRVARSYTKKDDIILFNGHYHGWGDTFAASSNRSSGSISSLVDHTIRVDYNNLLDIEKALCKNNVAAVMMEPVSLDKPDTGFLRGVRELCDKYNALLIFDEIITGFRWSITGAQGYYGVSPDITLFSKAIANGMPISIIGGSNHISMEISKVFFSGTFFGETLSIAAAIATINKLKSHKEELYSHIWKNGTKVKNIFNLAAKRLGVDVKMVGLPPRQNFKFFGDNAHVASDIFRQEMAKRGVLIGSQFYVTWAHREEHIGKVIRAMEESLSVMARVGDKNLSSALDCIEMSKTAFKDETFKK